MVGSTAYTPEEVAKILKITRFTVYEMIKRGDLPAYRIGRKARVEAADLEAYIRKSKSMYQVEPQPVFKQELPQIMAQNECIICGQDILLDVLTRQLVAQMPNIRFLRNYIGSIDGLLALYRGAANAVTTHLWDSDTDDYNVPYVRRLIPGHRTVIINLAFRMEGFYVLKGNPLGIADWQDLSRPDIRFANRERGSGARVLVDEKLRYFSIEPQQVNGYDNEQMSHLAVASCVARGEANVGIGIEKAAMQVKDIEFIPLQKERYDLVIRKEEMNRPQFQSMLSVLRSTAFKNEIAGMGGYDISRTGQIIAEI